MLNCFDIIALQLKLLLEIATVYAKGIHTSENLEQSFSPYSQQMRAIKYMYGSLKLTIPYQPVLQLVKFLSSLHHKAINWMVLWLS